MRGKRPGLLHVLACLGSSAAILCGADLPDKYRKWLNEDALYLISQREAAEFKNLATDEEREAFIERFWRVRDPDPSTEVNEYRQAHYRRLDEANQKFSEAVPGWRTERGRVYVMHGPPDSIRFEYGGGNTDIFVQNPTNILSEFGPVTKVPMLRIPIQLADTEVWLYHHLTGARYHSGAFQVMFTRANVPAVHNFAREFGLQGRSGRQNEAMLALRDGSILRFLKSNNTQGPFKIVYAGAYEYDGLEHLYQRILSPGRVDALDFNQIALATVDLDEPRGEVLERRLDLRRRLQQSVTSRVFFNTFELRLQEGSVRAPDGRTNLTLTLGVSREHEGDELEFLVEIIRPDGGVAATVIEALDLKPAPRDTPRADFLYTTRLEAKPGDYRLSVIGRLKESQALAHIERDVALPDFSSHQLALSDLLLFRDVIRRGGDQDGSVEECFLGGSRPLVLKDFVLVPASDLRFRRADNLTAFVEIYNPLMNPDGSPQLDLTFRFWQGDQLVSTLPEKSLDYLTQAETVDSGDRRTSYGISIPLRSFSPGSYRLELEVADRQAGRSMTKAAGFQIR